MFLLFHYSDMDMIIFYTITDYINITIKTNSIATNYYEYVNGINITKLDVRLISIYIIFIKLIL